MLVIVYTIRYLSFFVFRVKNIKTATFIAPRGLITVLLFFQIPDSLKYSGFDGGVIFLMVIFTSIIMSVSLIAAKNK
jgi:NhaP-type Na+/H+ or K+/H+ antiporter